MPTQDHEQELRWSEQDASETTQLNSATLEACVHNRRRSRHFHWQAVSAAAVLVSLAGCLIYISTSRAGSGLSDSVKADTSAVTNLQEQGGLLNLEVGTASRAYAQTSSPVSCSFNVNGVWTPDEELFQTAHRGETISTQVLVSQWPSQLRLTILGTDGYGMRSIRMTLNGETRVLLLSTDGDKYGPNQFWLDGDDNGLATQVYAVPGIFGTSGYDASTALRHRLAGLLVAVMLIGLVILLGFVFKERILELLGRQERPAVGGNYAPQAPQEMPIYMQSNVMQSSVMQSNQPVVMHR